MVRVALAQVITGRDLADNLRLLEEYARKAKDGGAELVVFPEAMMRAFGNSWWTSPSPWTARGPAKCDPSPTSCSW
jgi:predicted amidohydrolase